MNLYEIPYQHAAWLAEVEAAQGELTPEAEAAFAAIQGSLEERAGAACHAIRNLQAQAEMLRRESGVLAAKAQAVEKRARTVKELLLRAMKGVGLDGVHAGPWRISIRRAPYPRFTWSGNDEMPSWASRTLVEMDPLKVREAWKFGASLEGFRVDHTEFLHID